jgi:hypothetical protein
MKPLALFSCRRSGRTPFLEARFRAAALVLGAALCLGSGATAEEVLHAPDAVRACLCRDQNVASLARSVAEDRHSYEAAEGDFTALSGQADAARQKLDPADAAGRAALGGLLDRRDAARDRVAQAAAPLNAAVERYNAAVAGFNGDCAGKAYDPAVLADVRPNLACPP